MSNNSICEIHSTEFAIYMKKHCPLCEEERKIRSSQMSLSNGWIDSDSGSEPEFDGSGSDFQQQFLQFDGSNSGSDSDSIPHQSIQVSQIFASGSANFYSWISSGSDSGSGSESGSGSGSVLIPHQLIQVSQNFASSSDSSDPWIGSDSSDPWIGSDHSDLWTGSDSSDPWTGSDSSDPWTGSDSSDPWISSAGFD